MTFICINLDILCRYSVIPSHCYIIISVMCIIVAFIFNHKCIQLHVKKKSAKVAILRVKLE